ncbi:hypothetical protein QQS21_010350 [Conoideocrella luteorostrata]|uniref:NB-ARC domain-containing protein n=1 Tax=Conoideocrella luteorostrata TaxID=1105319 RepID=A0AAJ0CFB0_9HYPO|nr:hypothetical protein QQS21_010350 [Conoideocrella luteorostrata]
MTSINHLRLVNSQRSPSSLIQQGDQCFKETQEHIMRALDRLPLSLLNIEQVRGNIPPPSSERCMMAPALIMTPIYDRVEAYSQMDTFLDSGKNEFASLVLYGPTALGKSTIACEYAKKRFDEGRYDNVLWANGESLVSVLHSFTNIALRLKIPGARSDNHQENCILVQSWLRRTKSTWLLVYDNVDTADSISPYFAQSNQGRAIFKTRNAKQAHNMSTNWIHIEAWDKHEATEFLFDRLRKDRKEVDEADDNAALTLAELVSGNSLELRLAATSIFASKYSVAGYLDIYQKNPRVAQK